MKRSAILVIAFATALSAGAQRGAHAGMAFHSAPVAHAAPIFRSRMAPPTGFHATPRPFIRATRAYPARPVGLHQPPLRYPAIAPPGPPRFYQRNNSFHSPRRVHPFGIIAYPTSVVGFLPDTGLYDDSYNAASQQPDYTPAEYPEYAPNYPDYGAEYAQYPPPGNAVPVAEVPSSTANPETVTLIFNNGQPPELIQNYLATRTTLTVIDGVHHRDIAIADLDVPATIKANRAAGIDFSLPTATH